MEILRYQDFELEIAAALPGGRYPVAVLRSPSGQARGAMEFPYDQQDRERQLARLEDAILTGGPESEQLVQDFGEQLFQALFPGEVRTVYDRSRQAMQDAGQGLRLKLRVNAPELSTVPWEYLYDPRSAEFIALSRYTPIVLYVELPMGETPLAVKPPLHILGMVASPSDAPTLDVDREKMRLEEAIAPLRSAGRVDLTWLEGSTWRDLQEAMQRGPWHVFHFIGHATSAGTDGAGALLLTDEAGRAAALGAQDLGTLLADQRTLRLAVLNACEGARPGSQGAYSSVAAALVRRGVPAVVAMQYAISDRAALEFSGSFYGALAANLPIDAAVSEARKAIDLALPESVEWGTPVLFMRTPDGVLWDVRQRRSLPIAAMAAMAAAALAVIGLLAFIATRTEEVARAVNQPTPTPLAMQGVFNIAVADFGEIDPVSGEVRDSFAGQTLSGWLYEGLNDELVRNRDIPLTGDIVVWHSSREDLRGRNVPLGLVRGATPAAREAAVAGMADALNAQMVIYGNIITGTNRSELDVEFYLPPQATLDELGLLAGSHVLGQEIQLPVPFNLEDPRNRFGIRELVGLRSKALYWLTAGLAQQLLGRSEEALATFRRAEEELQGWPDPKAQALLQFFVGREQLFLKDLDGAEASFAQAIGLDESYARAVAALGSVYQARAAETEDFAARLGEPGALQRAIELQTKAVDQAAGSGDATIEAVARTALALSQNLLCEAHLNLGSAAEAGSACDRAVQESDRAVSQLAGTPEYRILAQAYMAQGNAQFLRSFVDAGQQDMARSRERLDLAAEAYTRCIDQAALAPFDRILTEKIVAGVCEPAHEQVQARLSQLEDSP